MFLHTALFLLQGKILKDLRLILVHMHEVVTSVLRIGKKRWEYSLDQPERLFKDFPKAKFVASLRNPICTAESNFNNYVGDNAERELRGNVFFATMLWGHLYGVLEENHSIFMIKLLDLHRHFEEVMEAVCSFLEISYDPSLRESTFYGNPFSLPGKQKVQTNRPNPDFIDWKGGILSEYEISVVRFFCRDIIKTFFPENATQLHLMDYLRVGKYCLSAMLSVFQIRSLQQGYHEYFVPFRDFLRFYPNLKKLRSLDISHIKTYENMRTLR